MAAEIKRTVISNIGFKIRDTTAPAAQPGWRERRSLAILSAQFAVPWPTDQPKDFQNPGNGQPWN